MTTKKDSTGTKTSRSRSATKRAADELVDQHSAVSDVDDSLEKKRLREAREEVAGQTVDKMVASLAKVEVDLGKGLLGVKQLLTEQLNEYTQLEDAIQAAEQRLEEIQGKEIVAQALKDIIAEYEAKKTKLEEDYKSRKEETESELKSLADRKKEEEEKIKREREKEQSAYEYKRDADRQRERFEYEEIKRSRDRDERIKREEEEENLSRREKALADSEKELAELRLKADSFDEEVKNKVEAEKGKLHGIFKKEFEHKAAVAQTEHNAAVQILTAERNSAQERVSRLEVEIEKLHGQLATATEKIQAMATAVTNASSGKQALDEVKEVAMAQASNKK